MATRADITPELCRQLLRYEPETGKLFWKQRSASMYKDSVCHGAFEQRNGLLTLGMPATLARRHSQRLVMAIAWEPSEA